MLAGNTDLAEQSRVEGDVSLLGGSLTVRGYVRGDVNVLAGNLQLADTAEVGGNVTTLGGNVNRSPGAQVRGNVIEGLRGPRLVDPLGIEERTREQVRAQTTPNRSSPFDRFFEFLLWQFGTVGLGLIMALLGIVAVVVAPNPMAEVARTVGRETALSFALGLLTFVLALLLGAILLIACGLGLLVWLAAGLTTLFGWLAVGYWLGQRILRGLRGVRASAMLEVAVGVFLIVVMARLPWCIGFFAQAIIGSIGVGAVLLTRFGTQPRSDRPGPVALLPAGPDEAASGI